MTDAIETATNPTSTPEEPLVPASTGIRRQVADALYLLDYAVASGFKAPDGLTLSKEVVTTIKITAAKVGVTEWKRDDEPDDSARSIPTSDWATFELAYYKLARFTAPVTAETLRATEVTSQWIFLNMSPAQKFSKLLWLFTLAFTAFTVGADWGLQRYGPIQDGEVDAANSIMQLVQTLVPFAYGGLGSCVYLLRSAHIYLAERTFDVRRMPEYYNRIVLGMIGGGAIVLFVNQVTTDNGNIIQLSAAALGFLGGYSTDFLFNTIERVINAILPKVGLQSVRTSAPVAKPPLDITAGDLTLKELLERFEKAQGADKELYKSLIEKLRERA